MVGSAVSGTTNLGLIAFVDWWLRAGADCTGGGRADQLPQPEYKGISLDMSISVKRNLENFLNFI